MDVRARHPTFGSQPMLSDGVVWLTPWRLDDAVTLGDFNLDADFRRWFDQPLPAEDPAVRREHGAEVIERWHREWADGTSMTFAVRLEEHGQAIGEADLQPRPPIAANIAYATAPSHRGNGYASRAVRLLARCGLTRFGFSKIVLTCDVGNDASARVAEKAGFSFEGVRRASAVYDHIEEWVGTPRDERQYSLGRNALGANAVDPTSIVRHGYDAIGADYRPWSDAIDPYSRPWFVGEALERIPLGADVLELGCGPGIDAVAFAEGRTYTGVDISPVMVELARIRLPDATIVVGDLTKVAFPEASFDAVVSLLVFGHVPPYEHRTLFDRVFRWLRPSGVFCASFPTGSDEGTVEDFLGTQMYFGGIGTDATLAELGEAGFTIELADTRESLDSSESFLWVVARKPP